MNTAIFQEKKLSETHSIWKGELPEEFSYTKEKFDTLWNLHPTEFHTVKILGKEVNTPRWQQAYGKDYRYTGAKQNALEVPEILKTYQTWCQENINPDFNGLLLNWYEGTKKHYIGAHRDDTRDLVNEKPIVTISLGEERIFRLRPYGEKSYQDFLMQHGTVIILPWETNLHWTHEVPHFVRFKSKRISITLRVFIS